MLFPTRTVLYGTGTWSSSVPAMPLSRLAESSGLSTVTVTFNGARMKHGWQAWGRMGTAEARVQACMRACVRSDLI